MPSLHHQWVNAHPLYRWLDEETAVTCKTADLHALNCTSPAAAVCGTNARAHPQQGVVIVSPWFMGCSLLAVDVHELQLKVAVPLLAG